MPTRRSGRRRKATLKASEYSQADDFLGSPESGIQSPRDDLVNLDFSHVYNQEYVGNGDESSESDATAEEREVVSVLSNDDEDRTANVVDAQDISSNYGWSQRRRSTCPNTAKPRHSPLPSCNQGLSGVMLGKLHSRGVSFNISHVSRERVFKRLTGNDLDETRDFLEMLEQYYGQLTLPSRQLRVEGSRDSIHLGFKSRKSRSDDAQHAWDWYFKRVGRGSFSRLQIFKHPTVSFTNDRIPRQKAGYFVSSSPRQSVLYRIEHEQCIPLSECFKGSPLATATKDIGSRRGWLLYPADSVDCLAWAPSHADSAQFLTLSTAFRPPVRSTANTSSSRPSAFTPAAQRRSSIQIWRVAGKSVRGLGQLSVSTEESPRCIRVFNTSWGEITQLKWCDKSRSTSPEHERSGEAHLGLLATISKDGFLRVLDVDDISTVDSRSQPVNINQCAFVAKPPETICTCVAWISTTLIAVGCANGFVAVWDLEHHFQASTPTRDPQPEFYRLLHTTYIVELNTCHPSHPHIILSSSSDGYLRSTDIRSPDTDYATTLRSRTPYVGLEWVDHCLSIICADDSYTLKCSSLRVLDHFAILLRFPAPISCLATSPLHVSALVGGIDGTVSITNCVRRLFCRRNDPYFKQVWFKNEWRRPRSVREPNCDTASGQHQGASTSEYDTLSSRSHSRTSESDPRRGTSDIEYLCGISRLTSGYRAQNMLEQDKQRSKNRQARKNILRTECGQPLMTVFERSTGITSLSWNPNVEASGWAAAGLGNGFVFVEDLCYDQ